MSARCARVSTFCTRLGAPRSPDSTTGRIRSAGTAGRPAMLGQYRGLLAGHEAGRRRDQFDGQPVPAGRLTLRRGPRASRPGTAAGRYEVGAAGTDRLGGQPEPVEYEMRRVAQQGPVLAAGRFTLGGVADHDGFAACPRGRVPTAASLRQVGNAAPPRPVSPASRRASTSPVAAGSGPCARRVPPQVGSGWPVPPVPPSTLGAVDHGRAHPHTVRWWTGAEPLADPPAQAPDDGPRRTARDRRAATAARRRCRYPGSAARRPASTGTRASARRARRADPAGSAAGSWRPERDDEVEADGAQPESTAAGTGRRTAPRGRPGAAARTGRRAG